MTMSTPISSETTPSERFSNSVGSATSAVGSNTFEYQPVPILAPVSIGVALLSFSTFIIVGGALLGVIAAILASVCLWQIKKADGEYGGTVLASVGLGLSCVIPMSGLAYQYYEYKDELPEGYRRVNFVRDISDKEFIFANGSMLLHPDVQPLEGQQIFIKGYMYQSKQMEGLKSFVLLKDNGECCFGGDPKPFDMIAVRMVDDMLVDGVEGLISVGGVLRVNLRAAEGEPVYILESDFFSRARSIF